MFNVILFGAPGSGKGTQSAKLLTEYGLVHLSTGDILRNEIAHNTPLGREAKSIMSAGKLVSDDIVIGMIQNKLNEHKHVSGFLFDGFPRTVAQAEALDKLLYTNHTLIHLVVCLEVPELELIDRLLKRGAHSGRPDDSNKEIIASRIEEYKNKTSLVIEYYKPSGKVHNVKGLGSIEEIYTSISTLIRAHKG